LVGFPTPETTPLWKKWVGPTSAWKWPTFTGLP
jgi:hypothetical protein